jgi:hypothetical protein
MEHEIVSAVPSRNYYGYMIYMTATCKCGETVTTNLNKYDPAKALAKHIKDLPRIRGAHAWMDKIGGAR